MSVTVFDDLLARTGNEQSAVTRGLQMARQRARADAPDEFCSACVRDTPLAFENASDAHTVRFMRDAARAVQERIVELDGRSVEDLRASEEELDLTDLWWIRDEMNEAYLEAYWDACASPDECEVCKHPSAYDECGHEEYGETCPVRGEQA